MLNSRHKLKTINFDFILNRNKIIGKSFSTFIIIDVQKLKKLIVTTRNNTQIPLLLSKLQQKLHSEISSEVPCWSLTLKRPSHHKLPNLLDGIH